MTTKVFYDPYSQFKKIEFENGFNIYYLDIGRPWIKGTFMLNAGNKDSPVGKSGLAHFVEHLVFENHDVLDYTEVNDFFEELGGYIGATTYISQTNFSFCVSDDEIVFGDTINIFSQLLLNNKIGNNFEKQRNIILQEINESFPDNQMEYYHSHTNFVFQDTPFQGIKSTLGSLEEFNNLSLEDCVNFYLEYYQPQNMSLVLIGNISSEIKNIIFKSRFALKTHIKKNSLSQFHLDSFNKKRKIVFTKEQYPFLSKAWKRLFVFDFSVNMFTLYIHKEMLHKILFQKFREELQANYGFSLNIETLPGFTIYSVIFPINSINHSKIETIFEECLAVVNREVDLFQKSKNSLIKEILMRDLSFQDVLYTVVNQLHLYGRIRTYHEKITGYEAVTFQELKEFNNFLVSKSNRYIEIIK